MVDDDGDLGMARDQRHQTRKLPRIALQIEGQAMLAQLRITSLPCRILREVARRVAALGIGMPVDDMADAPHSAVPRLSRQQNVDLRIVQRGKGHQPGGKGPILLGLTVEPMRLIDGLIAIGPGIDMHRAHRVPLGQIAAVILGQIVLSDGLDTAVGAIVIERPGQPRIAQMFEIPQMDMRINKGDRAHSPAPCRSIV
jgi:hypothetical protein